MIYSLIINNFCFLLSLLQLRAIITGKAWALWRKHAAENLHKVTKCVCVCAFKGIKAKPYAENKAEDVYTAAFFSKNSIFSTANNRGHSRGYFVTTQRMWYRYFLMVERKQWVLPAAQYGLSVCWYPQLSLSPAGSSAHTFLVRAQSWPRAQRKQAAVWGCQGQFCTWLLLQEGSVWERKAGFLTNASGVLKVWGVLVPTPATAFLQDVCCQIWVDLLFVSFCHRSSTTFLLFSLLFHWGERPHNEHGDIHGSSFLLVLDCLLVVFACDEKTPGDQAIQ